MYSTDDQCQYWLNKTSRILTSPNHPILYDLNLNCKWILKADEGFYVNLEINSIQVKYET